MKKILLALITLFTFLFWDVVVRIRHLFNRRNIEPWIDLLFHRICNLLFSFTSALVNVHIHFEQNKEINLPKTFLIIANHQSIQDIPLLIWSFPKHDLRFSAKDSLFRGIPTVSLMLRLGGHGRIDRKGNISETMKTLTRVAEKSRNGYCPVIFPEGTRSKDGNLGVFHHGAVRKMLSTNSIPVISVAIEGGWRVGDVKGLLNNMSDFDFHVKVLHVYDAPASKNDVQKIIEDSQKRIAGQLEIWREEDRLNPKTKKGCHIRPN